MLTVSSIQLENFAVHNRFDLTLPKTGVLLVTGRNGSGKSSIVESVATALWGKTLRGTSPWRPKTAGSVTITGTGAGVRGTDDFQIRRAVNKSGKVIDLSGQVGSIAIAGDTPTKSQAVLSECVPPWDVWRYGATLSAHDADIFGLATDATRKDLLETMLALESTEPAAQLVRERLKASRDEVHKLEIEVAKVTATMESAATRLEQIRTQASQAQITLNQSRSADEINAAGRALAGEIAAVKARLEAVTAAQRDIAGKLGEARAAVATAKREAAQAAQDICGTCGRPFEDMTPEERQECVSKAKLAQKTAEADIEALNKHMSVYESQHAAIQAESVVQMKARDELRAELMRLESAKKVCATLQTNIDSAQDEIAQTSAKLAELNSQLSDVKRQMLIREHAEDVLGTRGLRTFAMANTLDQLTWTTNAWMSRLAGPNFRVVFKAYSSTNRGAIAMDIVGKGGGLGYRATSGGERKRIDLAVLLALGDLSRTRNGWSRGTLFFDEVFDALDAPGLEAVAGIIRDLAQDRCVVVISHNQELVRALKPTATLIEL